MFNPEGRHTQKQPTEQKSNYSQKVSMEEWWLNSGLIDKMGVYGSSK